MNSLGFGSFICDVTAMRGTASTWRPITEAECFPSQWEAITDESNAQVWWGSRRMAKTATVNRRTVKRSSERPGWRTLIIHHTRMLGKQQVYETGDAKNPGIRELLKSHGIAEAHHDLTELNVSLVNGSFVQIVGCDDSRDVGKKLGFQWNDIVIIECQEFDDDILERLVDKTILPTLIDRRGSLTMEGTPAEVEGGVWYKAITEPGFVKHHWTLLDNPFINRQNIVDTMAMRGFVVDFDSPENNDPLVQREIFGRQVVDPEGLMYCYRSGVNDWPNGGIPMLDAKTWRFALGVDIGGVSEGNDWDGIVVLGWRMDDSSHAIYERESWRGKGDSEEFCVRVIDTYKRWQPMQSACADTGGAGAVKMLATLAPRFGGLQLTPKPTSVETSQRLVNDELRSGRMKLNPNGEIVRALKLCRKGKHELDVAAGFRYAHHGALNFLAKDPPKKEESYAEYLERNIQTRIKHRRQGARGMWANAR